MIDLHAHTTASDGTFSPTELVALAARSGVKTLAVTDHDTTDGLPEAKLAAASHGTVEIIAGVEFSAEFFPGTMHLLGYGFDPAHAGLAATLAEMRQGRLERIPGTLDALTTCGFPLTEADVLAVAGDSRSLGRLHIAQAMVQRGYVATVQEAFTKWLDRGRPGYVRRPGIDPGRAIEVTRAAGGVVVLAHPYQLRPQSPEHLDEIVRSLVELGLDGIEVWYSQHTAEMSAEYETLADRYGLITTGGSDFHGANKPQIQLGTGTGALLVPDRAVTGLHERRQRYQ